MEMGDRHKYEVKMLEYQQILQLSEKLASVSNGAAICTCTVK